MKVIIFALLLTAIAAQVPTTPNGKAWHETCGKVYAKYHPSMGRRLQAPEDNKMYYLRTTDCVRRCYDRCMCNMNRRLQVAVTRQGCSERCGGGGEGRRLQSKYRQPACTNVRYLTCYEREFRKAKTARRLQALSVSPEQKALNLCKNEKLGTPKVDSLIMTCQINTVCSA